MNWTSASPAKGPLAITIDREGGPVRTGTLTWQNRRHAHSPALDWAPTRSRRCSFDAPVAFTPDGHPIESFAWSRDGKRPAMARSTQTNRHRPVQGAQVSHAYLAEGS
jgi:hypothetical protein